MALIERGRALHGQERERLDVRGKGTVFWQDYGTEVDMYMANEGCSIEWLKVAEGGEVGAVAFCRVGRCGSMTRAFRGAWLGCCRRAVDTNCISRGVLDASTSSTIQSAPALIQATLSKWLTCPSVCAYPALSLSSFNALTGSQCSTAELVSSRLVTPARYADHHTHPYTARSILKRPCNTELSRTTVPVHRRSPNPPYRRANRSRCPAQGHHVW